MEPFCAFSDPSFHRGTRRIQRQPLSNQDRIDRRDEKLLKRELANAAACGRTQMPCKCKNCDGMHSRDIGQVVDHLRTIGRAPWYRKVSAGADQDSSDEEWQASLYDANPSRSSSEAPHPEPEASTYGCRPTWYPDGQRTAPILDNVEPDMGQILNDTRFQEMVLEMYADILPDTPEQPAESPAESHEHPPNRAESGQRNHEHGPGGFEDPTSEVYKRAFKKIYEGSNETVLDFTVTLINLCVEHRVPKVFIDSLLSLMKKRYLPKKNLVPRNTYEAEKLMNDMGLTCVTYDACTTGCILYRKKYEHYKECPICHHARWKNEKSKIPFSRLRHFPLIPRLLRMFKCRSLSQLMRWFADNLSDDGLQYHAADSEQWRFIDQKYPWFAAELRNLRFGLLLDGVNPFNLLSSKHSLWPIMLVNYNLPPWLATKKFFIMLFILVSGPKSITYKSINTYLEPLIEELQQLWKGVPAFDALAAPGSQHFKLHGMVMWTINDYPALGYISGLCVHGNKACCVCGGANPVNKSKVLGKFHWTNHRMWLNKHHPLRGVVFAHKFNGFPEHGPIPVRQSARTILRAARLKKAYDKTGRKHNGQRDPFRRDGVRCRSIMYDLEYWRHMPVKHCVDVMHLTKNVSENLLGWIVGNKDTVAVREDLKRKGIRPELWIDEDGNMPPANYTCTPAERDLFYKRLKSLKVPDGFSGNWDKKVELHESDPLKHELVMLKAHDHHVLMQKLLRYCLRGLMDKRVRHAIFAYCDIFVALCQKPLDPSTFKDLVDRTIDVLVELEQIFPPAFFTVMNHLTLHATQELRWCGPVHTRWMFFGERILSHFARYTQNRSHVAGSISACYVREEMMGFATEYMTDMTAYRSRVWDAEEEPGVAGEVLMGAGTPILLEPKELAQIHEYVLDTVEVLEPWRRAYRDFTSANDADSVPPFSEWLPAQVDEYCQNKPKEDIDSDLFFICRLPSPTAISYKHIKAYGNHFRIADERSKSLTTYGSGVCGYFPCPVSPDSDKTEDVEYIGELTHILHIQYCTNVPIVLFKARWIIPEGRGLHPSVRPDADGLTEVNFKQCLPLDEDPYVWPRSVLQVFFMAHDNPSSPWKMVLRHEPRSARKFQAQVRT